MEFLSLLSTDIEKIPHSESLEEFLTDYKCLQMIGEGGFGRVQKAIQLNDRRNVAIKFVSDKKISTWHFDEKHKKEIPMEIALMCRCHDVPGVIKIIKYFQIREHNGWYIVMERFEKYIDLFDFITNQGYINEKLAANFMRQLLKTLIGCHNLGICHRDIKDENIVINLETMKIYLIDFGAGGILNDGVYTEFDGTRVYSPPEWIQSKQYEPKSLEVWSLGILLFDMVCGNLPFDNDDSIINGIFSYRYSPSVHCQDLIQKCLQYDPVKRISITDILSHHWLSRRERPRNAEQWRNLPRLPTSVPTTNVKYSTCCNPPQTTSNSRRVSLETSPFTTPQSSGLEDSEGGLDQLHNSANICPHRQPEIVQMNHLNQQKHNINGNISKAKAGKQFKKL